MVLRFFCYVNFNACGFEAFVGSALQNSLSLASYDVSVQTKEASNERVVHFDFDTRMHYDESVSKELRS